VIFSVGVIMVLQLTTALSAQMEYAAKTSSLVARVQERLDSLEALPFASLSQNSRQETMTIRGVPYVMTTALTKVTAILYRLDVTLAPVTAGAGPTYSTTSYSAAPW
jgi:hypothetical protein